MKPIIKKSLVIGASILTPIAIVAISTAVYFSTSKVQRISNNGIYKIRVKENLNNDGYKFDYSASYGSPTPSNRLSTLIVNEIIHLKTSGKFKYESAKKDEDGNEIKPGKVVEPSYESYKFANANSLVLTFISTSVTNKDLEDENFFKKPENKDKYFQLIFDNDDDSIKPDHNGQFIVNRISDNNRSINNPDVFWKIMNSGYLGSKPNLDDKNVSINTTDKNFIMHSLGVTFDSGAKWVDSKGNQTKYRVKAKDMLYSAKRTWLFDKTYRREHGGSKELDQYFTKKTNASKIFGETQKYPNEYLFDFFGVDKSKLYDEKNAILKVEIPETNKITEAYSFTFNIFEKDGSIDKKFSFSASDLFKKYLTNSIHFSLAPSEYIDEVYNTEKNNTTLAGKIKGEAAQYGIYTYGQTRETTLYASNYIPVYSKENREIYEYNKYYPQKWWINSVENGEKNENGKTEYNLKKIIIEYAGGVDASTFTNQAFDSFMNGTLSQIDYSSITASQKQKIYGTGDYDQLVANAQANGLSLTKKVNISGMTSRTVWLSNPLNNANYSFNDNYAKIVYGGSTSELKSGKLTTSNSFYAGYGFNFRTLLQSSINWHFFIQQAYSGTRDVWLSGAAQDAKFYANDDSLTPKDFNEKGLNDVVFFDKDGQKQVVTLKAMKKLSNMTIEELEEVLPGSSKNPQQVKMQSPSFLKIQAAMKSLLDKAYEDMKLDKNSPIEFEIAYPYYDQDETKSNATKYVVENVINELDPRIKAKFVKPTTREEMQSAIAQKRSAFNYNGWSYDYEGIGSYISGYASDGGGTNIANAIGIFSKDVDNDSDELFKNVSINGTTIVRPSRDTIKKMQDLFPNFTLLSKYSRKMMNEFLSRNVNPSIDEEVNKKRESIMVQNWDLISNSESNMITKWFTQKYDTNNEKWIPDLDKNPNQIDLVSGLASIFKSFEYESPWQNDDSLSLEQKGQKWTDLIQELNSIKGISIEVDSSVERLENINFVLYLKEYIVPLSKYGILTYADIKYIKEG